jgi:hypothetical protein
VSLNDTKMNTKKDNLNRPDSESYLQSTLPPQRINGPIWYFSR